MKKIFLFLCAALCCITLAAKDLTGIKIYVNPGHGGYDTGSGTNVDDRNVPSPGHPAGDVTGFWESQSNLNKGLHLRDELLRHNATVKMNRTTNTSADDWGMTAIANDADVFNPDAFLAIHSNALGGVNSSTNYLSLIYRGYPQPSVDTVPALRESKNMCRSAFPYMLNNPLTVWTAYYPYNPNNIKIGPNPGGVQMYIYVPGFLSEGEFHDYIPETCRLLNTDYDHLEAIRFLNFFLDYFGAARDATGTLAGYVKDKEAKATVFNYVAGSDDQWMPLNGAQVILRTAAGDSISSYTCDNNYNGVFVFYNLAPGNYQLQAIAADHATETVNVTVAGGGEITYQKIFMQNSTDIPRIYASELNAAQTTAGYDLSFTLNTDAANVVIKLISSTNDTITIPAGALLKGRNTVSVSNSQVPAGGTYTWEVTASAGVISNPVQFTNNSDSQVRFYYPMGVAVDNDFNSPYFGRIYVTSSNPGTTVARPTGRGVYILDAAITDITGQGNVAYTGSVTWTTTGVQALASPMRCNVAPNGQVYITDYSDGNSGVYVMNPADPSAAFRQVFGGTRAANGLISSGGVAIGGSVTDCYVLGDSSATQLYTADGDYQTGLTAINNVLQYNIGSSTAPWVSAPSAVVFNNGAAGTLETAGNSAIAPDGRGGWFISQSRNSGADTPNAPVLIHISALGNIDFNSGSTGLIGSSYGGGMAVSYDGSLLAIVANGDYKVYNVTYNATNVPTLTLAYDITPAPGQINYSLAFDRADNLYAVSPNAQLLVGYGLPTANNTFTTPAPLSQTLDFVATGINEPQQSAQIQVYPNPIQNVVHVTCGAGIESVKLIDLTGRTVMNIPIDQQQISMDINMSGITAGSYILLVNNTPVKVMKK